MKINKENIAVIFGGNSVEHDISIITGVQTLNNIDRTKYNVFPIYISKNNDWYISNKFFDIKTFQNIENINNFAKKIALIKPRTLFYLSNKKAKVFCKIDFAFLCTHGSIGENGTLQGFLDMCALPYSSSSVLCSAVGMNKLFTKVIAEEFEINISNFICLNQFDFKNKYKNCVEKIKKLKFPLIVKPCSLGSSIGINICQNILELKNALTFAFLFDSNVLIEEKINNLREFNIAVMGSQENCENSDIEEVFSSDNFLSFENKYLNRKSSAKGMENTLREIPAKILPEIENEIRNCAIKIFKLLDSKGIIRFDFLFDNKEKVLYLNEINTIPGSLSNYLWKTKKYKFSDILENLKNYAIDYEKIKNSKITNFNSNVLKQFNNDEKFNIKK